MSERIQLDFSGRTMSIESGALAKQADGAALLQYGETVVLAAATVAKKDIEGKDFFPLMVDYRERMYSGGRVPGGFFKREGRPRDKETLASRMTDRTLRPLFPEHMRREVQVDMLILSHDGQNDPDVCALNAAATAVHLSSAPFAGPVAAVRVGRIGGEFVANPTIAQLATSEMDMIVASTAEKVVMIEGSANQIPESVMREAMQFAQEAVRPLLMAQEELRSKLGKPRLELPAAAGPEPAVLEAARSEAGEKMRKALANADKQSREAGIEKIKEDVQAALKARFPEPEKEAQISQALVEIEWEVVRDSILDSGVRPDGRGYRDLRTVSCRTGILPRTHGSALFQRGQTQALATVTLGTEDDAQKLEAPEGDSEKRYMLHYNFPAFSVGEVKPNRGPSRRDIGHGALAEKSFTHLLPKQDEFSYVLRAVSEILESNGSSSQATVCATSLALMDAGVPLKAPVAGVAVGLVQREGKKAILTDIQGLEDFMGDMDFKVAGTDKGITSVQLDVKTYGQPVAVLGEALEQSREARLKILEVMNAELPQAREKLSPYAPRVELVMVPPDKIGAVIGTGGKTIRKIIAESGCSKVEVLDDTGRIQVVAANTETLNKGVEMIRALTEEPELGKLYTGKVNKITDFGAFVEILPGTDGLVHVSEMAHERVRHPSDILKEGDEVLVKCIGIDPVNGKVRLSRKAALGEQKDAPAPEAGAAPARPESDPDFIDEPQPDFDNYQPDQGGERRSYEGAGAGRGGYRRGGGGGYGGGQRHSGGGGYGGGQRHSGGGGYGGGQRHSSGGGYSGGQRHSGGGGYGGGQRHSGGGGYGGGQRHSGGGGYGGGGGGGRDRRRY